MNRFVLLRDQNVDGNGGGGQSAPAQSQPTQQSSQGDQQVKDVWGGRSAPDWIKQASLGVVHDKTNVGAPVETDPMAPAGTQSQPAQGGQQQQQQQQPAAAPAQQQQQTPAQVQPQQQLPAAQPQTLDANTIAEAMVKAQQLATQRTGNPQAQPTQAEIAAQLGVFEATDKDYEELLGVKPDSPVRVAALNKMLQAVARQAVTISSVLQSRALEQQAQSISPYIATVRQQEVVRQQSLFATENPDLRGYEALAEKEFQVATAQGKKFPNVEAARKYIADQVRGTLKSLNITPVATQQQSQSSGGGSPTITQQRRMTTTSVGGRGGSSGGSSSQPASKVEAVWGKK